MKINAIYTFKTKMSNRLRFAVENISTMFVQMTENVKHSSLVERVLSEYGLNKNSFELNSISNGLINETWRVQNSSEDFILQKINHLIFKDPAAIGSNLRMLDDYLSANYPGYLFVAPLKTLSNQELVCMADGYFRLFSFVKNSHTIQAAKSPGQAFEAARQFGKFTRLLANFPIDKLSITLPNFHNLSLRYVQFQQAIQNGDKKRIERSAELIKFIEDNFQIVETYKSILNNPAFKVRVTHHDTKISNVLFDDDEKGLCIIDLDTVMPGHFISDVGDMMRTYLSPVSEEEKDFSKIEVRDEYLIAIRDGYMSEMENELTDEEKRHFIYGGKFMIYMQAIRFLADYINNDIYYGAKYEDQNFVRAGNQVVLLRHLTQKEKIFSV